MCWIYLRTHKNTSAFSINTWHWSITGCGDPLLTHWGRDKMDAIFQCIFLNENNWIPIEISLKFVLKGPFNNIPALVQIMAWRRPGDKPLSEPMMVSPLMHICVTQPQWINEDKNIPMSCIQYNIWLAANDVVIQEHTYQLQKFVKKKAYENLVCKMSVILCWP